MIIIKRILIFLCFFLLFNTLEVDSNSDKITYYDSDYLYDRNVHLLYFDDLNSINIDKLFSDNIVILSYIIDGNKYYARNTNELIEKYFIDKSLSEKVYYETNGFNIDGVNVLCSNIDIINLKKEIHIY